MSVVLFFSFNPSVSLRPSLCVVCAVCAVCLLCSAVLSAALLLTKLCGLCFLFSFYATSFTATAHF